MSVHRLSITLGAVGLAVASIVVLLTAPSISAATSIVRNENQSVQLAPPAQAPTLVAQTPDIGGLPPINLGELGIETTPTATTAPTRNDQIVLDLTYDECTPIQDEFINVECTDGALAFTRKETQGTRWIYYRPVLTDTLIELTARLPSQKNGRYGVMFRVDEAQDNFYILGVSNAGKYGLFRFAQDHYETIIPYTDSFNVGNAGFPTKIKIVNQGDVIAVNLGGQWEASIRDANLTEGKIALFFEPDEPNQTVLFDDLRVTALSTPMEVPQPSVVTPPATATTTGNQLPVLDLDTTPTTIPAEPTTIPAEPTTIPAEPTTILVAPTSQPQPTQTPIIIVVTAMPPPTAVPPTRAATRRPTQAACPAAANEALLYVSNNYQGTTMRFTIGGGEWGTHDYDVPGDGKYYRIHMPPGTYTYTAFIAGQGTAHGEKTAYLAGRCYSLRFSPN